MQSQPVSRLAAVDADSGAHVAHYTAWAAGRPGELLDASLLALAPAVMAYLWDPAQPLSFLNRTGFRFWKELLANETELAAVAAREYGRHGVRVNAICPGYTDTPLVERSLDRITEATGRSTDDALAGLLQGNPAGRLVRPEEVAATALWLCGPGSDMVTGQAIAVDGGET